VLTSDPHDEPPAPSDASRSGNRPIRAALESFYERRDRAWERVHQLEQKQSWAATQAAVDREKEAVAAHDQKALKRAAEQLHEALEERQAAVIEAPKARRRAMLKFELPLAVSGWVILAAAAAINSLWLAALGVDYLHSYLQSGFLVALLFGVVAVAIDLDSHPNLIVAQPLGYIRATLELVASLGAALTGLLAPPRSERALAEAGLFSMAYRFRLRTLDLALNLLFTLSFAAAMLAWAVLVAPLQYWVSLVCGAPAREALASSGTLWVVRSANRTKFWFAPKDPTEFEEEPELKEAYERGEMTEAGFAKKPVSFTAAVSAALLFGVSRFV